MHIDKLANAAAKKGASDIHVKVGEPPVFRIHGEMHRLDCAPMSSEKMSSLLKQFIIESALARLNEVGFVDGSFKLEIDGEKRSFRYNAFSEQDGRSVSIRLIPAFAPSPEELGIPKALLTLTEQQSGMILITGSTGSGKSTTLASLLDHVIQRKSCKISTVENPIEFPLRKGLAFVTRTEVPVNVRNYADSIYAMLRQDPDKIMVGEMRNCEELEAGIFASETGHMLFSTLHTRTVSDTITRIIDSFDSIEQNRIRGALASSVSGIFCQKLLKRKDGSGRVMAYEFMSTTPGIRNLIREGKDHQLVSTIQTSGEKYGMRLMDDSIFKLWSEDIVSVEEALEKAINQNELAKRIAEEKRNRDS